MRIGIEADRMRANNAGVGRYIRELVAALRRIADDEIELFSLPSPTRHYRAWHHPSRWLRGVRRLWWLNRIVPRLVRQRRIDVLFCPDYLIPRQAGCPVVATIYDLIFHVCPEWGEVLINRQLRICVPYTLRAATRIVVPSEFTQRELLRHTQCSPEKVRIVGGGPGHLFRPMSADAARATLARFQLEPRSPGRDGFLLSVGSLVPRKNLPNLVQAFGRLLRSQRGYRGHLVIVGPTGWGGGALARAIQDAGVSGRVRALGFVSDEALAILYSHADLFAFPSFYEGFGLPILEAMACGCPVVASGVSSIPEVAADAAVLVDPYSAASIAAGLMRVLGDAALQTRLQQAGYRRAAEFTWDRAAQTMRDIFAEAVGHG